MKFRRFGDRYLIRLYPGEEVVASLAAFARENGIQAGVLSGIGAVREAVLGYFDPDTRTYHKETLVESVEIAGMSGNLSLVDGEPTLHLHATLADRSHRTRAGHLFSAQVSVTVEVECTRLPGTVERKWDEETGLKLLNLD